MRYVALGDSSTEGLDDPDGNGRYRGWADRLAEHLARAQGSVLYANLAIRGRRTRQVLDEQLTPALAMRPDLCSAFVGTNDVIQKGFDVGRVRADLHALWGALRASGATVVSLTLPDVSEIIPFAKRLSPRIESYNEACRELAQELGVTLIDLARHPMATDVRIWSSDRLHANALGHTRIAAAIVHQLGISGVRDPWDAPLPPRDPATVVSRVRAELLWARDYLLPWVLRHARGRSSGDGISPKRPTLEPFTAR